MQIKFPNESSEYRQARDELLKAEAELREKIEQVAAQRRALPIGGKVEQDYEFRDINDQPVKLSELFRPSKNSLLIYSYMFGPKNETPCPACTSMLDSLNGSAPHITQAANLAVVISGRIEQAQQIKQSRGWKNLNLLSCNGNDYNRDYFGESVDAEQMPIMNVFSKTDSGIHHFWGSELLYASSEFHPRHIDLIWPMWNALDMTREGRSIDFPKLSYEDES